MVKVLAWHIKFKKLNALKKEISDESIPIAWHRKRW